MRPGPFTASGNIVGGTIADSIRTLGFNSFGTPSQVIGISAGGWPSTISGNTVQNLSSRDGVGTAAQASVIGIVTTDATVNHTIQANTIRDLTNSGGTSSLSSAITGIQFTGSSASMFERNHISRLFNSKTGTSAEANGIRVAGGTTVFRNNIIVIGDTISNAIGVNGIVESAGSNTYYHNSVLLNGSSTSGTGNSFGFNSSVVTNTRSIRNNIFYNARNNSGSSGKNYAVRVGGTAPNPAGLTINNNLYYVNGIGSVFGLFNSVDRTTLALWQTAVGQDAASVNGDPLFVNTFMGGTPDLHIQVGSPAMDVGANLGIGRDFDDQLRPAGLGYDIGADEALAPSASTVSVSGRILSFDGSGIRNVIVTLAGNGAQVTVRSSSFGYFTFEGVEAGQTYILLVISKRYTFSVPTRVITVTDNISDADFVAEPME